MFVLLLLLGLVIGGGIWVFGFIRSALTPPLSVACTASVGDTKYTLAPDQSANAALISGLSIVRGLPPRAASIALATALQESKLRNIDYGDMDSLGLFQQRPSQEWGTAEEIMDPIYSSNEFYAELEKIPDYTNMAITDAAQAVQRSAYPLAYAQHEGTAKAFASALTGESAASLSCTLQPLKDGEVVAAPTDVTAALTSNLGITNSSFSAAGASTTIKVAAVEAKGWATAQWAVANADAFGITSVSFAGHTWDRNALKDNASVGWVSSDAPADHVSIVMASAPKA